MELGRSYGPTTLVMATKKNKKSKKVVSKAKAKSKPKAAQRPASQELFKPRVLQLTPKELEALRLEIMSVFATAWDESEKQIREIQQKAKKLLDRSPF